MCAYDISLCGCCKNSHGITRQINNCVSLGTCRPCASTQAQGGADNRGTVFSKQRTAVRPAGRDILPPSLHTEAAHADILNPWDNVNVFWKINICIWFVCPVLHHFSMLATKCSTAVNFHYNEEKEGYPLKLSWVMTTSSRVLTCYIYTSWHMTLLQHSHICSHCSKMEATCCQNA